MTTQPRSKRPKQGFFLVLVLLVIIVATFGVYSFTGMMVAYDDAAYLTSDIVRARVAADSGSEAIRLILAQPPIDRDASGGVFNNPNLFQAVGVSNQDTGNVCNFSVVAPSLNELGQLSGIRFGLQDESAKLNINTLTILDENSEGLMSALTLTAGTEDAATDSAMPSSLATALLLSLPGMTEELADSILDWLDEDDDPRPYGVEADYYSTLPTPYEPTNGPVSSVEELLLVAGMTPTILFGADANRNGVLDPDEQQRFNVTVDTPGALGLAAYLTVYGNEANKARDGSFCVNINADDLEVLYEDLVTALEDETYASFICAYRMAGQTTSLAGAVANAGNQNNNNGDAVDGGMWSADYLESIDLSAGGSVEFKQVLDMVDATVTISNNGQQTIYQSPFTSLTAGVYLPLIMDKLSTNDTPTMPGRINLNECPAELLYGIPVLDEEQVGLILEARATESTDDNRNFETWPMVEGIVTLEQMRQLLPLVNAGGDVYRAQIVGYFESSGLSSRQEVVLDATTVNPKVIFYRDLSHLGRAFDLSVLGIRNTAAVLGDSAN
ncbi:type II secretion system protein GspK [Rhodopirellula sp. MGV]|uniref:type II secretion system protein GspK n=1 Tax=Rhodopirellula sp. MGV TaxID=2023130 RepID=UPI000B9664A4|nr:type II secretion system protein GspK [Rhodopirellula sp. MGV]OYP31106.1 general secretion pathway protein GspK [Rhodopirellula sp. MGV]PNY37480.1 general secretion pathway protein GspK [Rhodopirellula baltica]